MLARNLANIQSIVWLRGCPRSVLNSNVANGYRHTRGCSLPAHSHEQLIKTSNSSTSLESTDERTAIDGFHEKHSSTPSCERVQAVATVYANFQNFIRNQRKLLTDAEKLSLFKTFARDDANFSVLEQESFDLKPQVLSLENVDEETVSGLNVHQLKKAIVHFKILSKATNLAPSDLDLQEMKKMLVKPFKAKARYLRNLFKHEVARLVKQMEVIPLPAEVFTPSATETAEDEVSLILRAFKDSERCHFGMPSTITEEQIRELRGKTRASMLRYMDRLFHQELLLVNREFMKRIRKLRVAERLVENEKQRNVDQPRYGLWHNSLFVRGKQDKYVHRLNMLRAVLYGQPLVFDFSYEQYMSRLEIKSLCMHMMSVCAKNWKSRDAFDLWFCNYDANSNAHQKWLKSYGDEGPESFLIHCQRESYLDVFPKDRLVYLSPDSENVLTNYDHDAVYIIGCFVDLKLQRGMSYKKATEEGIATARLPIPELVKLRQHCCLPLSWVVQLLTSAKATNGDWNDAINILPSELILKKVVES